MNTNMIGLRWFKNICILVLWTKNNSSIERVNRDCRLRHNTRSDNRKGSTHVNADVSSRRRDHPTSAAAVVENIAKLQRESTSLCQYFDYLEQETLP